MVELYRLLALLLDVAFWIMLVFVIMSWLINFQVLNTRQPMVQQVWVGLNRLLQPIFDPIRRILPDTRPLDLSPLVVFVGIIALRDIILPAILL
ncbi:YggT family protein [Loktanella sp. IMCC34160]|uniref:YggT family protein n=1 Tax=Rhodobacterales TaxID=204455 RepID=UPI00101E04F6|nr:YggT family protein [Loktanella sp. IMCC34160]RYG91163.1 YggT family protein [Loktanella sp. IMCC34160]